MVNRNLVKDDLNELSVGLCLMDLTYSLEVQEVCHHLKRNQMSYQQIQ